MVAGVWRRVVEVARLDRPRDAVREGVALQLVRVADRRGRRGRCTRRGSCGRSRTASVAELRSCDPPPVSRSRAAGQPLRISTLSHSDSRHVDVAVGLAGRHPQPDPERGRPVHSPRGRSRTCPSRPSYRTLLPIRSSGFTAPTPPGSGRTCIQHTQRRAVSRFAARSQIGRRRSDVRTDPIGVVALDDEQWRGPWDQGVVPGRSRPQYCCSRSWRSFSRPVGLSLRARRFPCRRAEGDEGGLRRTT